MAGGQPDDDFTDDDDNDRPRGLSPPPSPPPPTFAASAFDGRRQTLMTVDSSAERLQCGPGVRPCELGHLLDPVPSTTYFQQLMEREGLLVRNRAKDFFSPFALGNAAEIDRFWRANAAASGRTDLLRNPTCKYAQHGFGVKTPKDVDTSLQPPWVAYLQGVTVVCDDSSLYYSPVARLVTDLGRSASDSSSGGGWVANLYLTPPGVQGFVVHNDQNDGFIVQTFGSKVWTLHHSATPPYPDRALTRGRPRESAIANEIGSVLWNGTVSAGDVLLVPRGLYHYASVPPTATIGSLHLTLSPLPSPGWLSWGDLALAALDATKVAESPNFHVQAVISRVQLALQDLVKTTQDGSARRSLWIERYNATPILPTVTSGLKKVIIRAWRRCCAGDARLNETLTLPALLQSVTGQANVAQALHSPELSEMREKYRNLGDSAMHHNDPQDLQNLQSCEHTIIRTAIKGTVVGDKFADGFHNEAPYGFIRFSSSFSNGTAVLIQQQYRDAVEFLVGIKEGVRFNIDEIPAEDPVARVALCRVAIQLGMAIANDHDAPAATATHMQTDL